MLLSWLCVCVFQAMAYMCDTEKWRAVQNSGWKTMRNEVFLKMSDSSAPSNLVSEVCPILQENSTCSHSTSFVCVLSDGSTNTKYVAFDEWCPLQGSLCTLSEHLWYHLMYLQFIFWDVYAHMCVWVVFVLNPFFRRKKKIVNVPTYRDFFIHLKVKAISIMFCA